MEELKDNFLTVRQFCEKYPWPGESALRAIIFDAARKENNFQKAIVRIGRRVLISDKIFWQIVKNNGEII